MTAERIIHNKTASKPLLNTESDSPPNLVSIFKFQRPKNKQFKN